MTTALAQHLLQKGSLSPYSFHGNPLHTMTTRRYHSQHFIDNHVYERFLGHGHASDETQQGGSLVQKLSVHQVDSLVQQLQQRFPSPPHVSNETPQRHVLFHRYLSLTFVTRLEGSLLLGTLCNLVSSLLLSLSGTFLLHPVRLVFLREGFEGLRHRRCFCRCGEFHSFRHDGRNEHDTSSNRTFLCPKTFCTSSSFDARSFGSQRLFDPVTCCTADRSQGGRFTRGNGGRCQECQERKETPSLTSFWSFATTYDPFSTSSSLTFGRHDVFDTMKGLRYRHAPLGFFFSVCPPPPPPPLATRARARAPPPPDPDVGGNPEKKNHTLVFSIFVLLHDIVGQRL